MTQLSKFTTDHNFTKTLIHVRLPSLITCGRFVTPIYLWQVFNVSNPELGLRWQTTLQLCIRPQMKDLWCGLISPWMTVLCCTLGLTWPSLTALHNAALWDRSHMAALYCALGLTWPPLTKLFHDLIILVTNNSLFFFFLNQPRPWLGHFL